MTFITKTVLWTKYFQSHLRHNIKQQLLIVLDLSCTVALKFADTEVIGQFELIVMFFVKTGLEDIADKYNL